jgi:hypothetical protein
VSFAVDSILQFQKECEDLFLFRIFNLFSWSATLLQLTCLSNLVVYLTRANSIKVLMEMSLVPSS